MKSILTTCVLLLFMESVLPFPSQGLGGYACMDQQIGDDQCSFYSSLYDVIEAELFCDHWGSRCCLSCVMMRMKQAQKAKETKSHGKDQKTNKTNKP